MQQPPHAASSTGRQLRERKKARYDVDLDSDEDDDHVPSKRSARRRSIGPPTMKRHRRSGKLASFVNMPLDVLHEVRLPPPPIIHLVWPSFRFSATCIPMTFCESVGPPRNSVESSCTSPPSRHGSQVSRRFGTSLPAPQRCVSPHGQTLSSRRTVMYAVSSSYFRLVSGSYLPPCSIVLRLVSETSSGNLGLVSARNVPLVCS